MVTLFCLPWPSFLLLTHRNSDVSPLHFTHSFPPHLCPPLCLQTHAVQSLLCVPVLSWFVFPSFTSYLALKAQLSYLFLSLNIFSEWRCLWLVLELCFKTSSCFVIFTKLGTPWGQNFCPFHGNIFSWGFLVYQLLLLLFHCLETCFWVIPSERFCLVMTHLCPGEMSLDDLFLRRFSREWVDRSGFQSAGNPPNDPGF